MCRRERYDDVSKSVTQSRTHVRTRARTHSPSANGALQRWCIITNAIALVQMIGPHTHTHILCIGRRKHRHLHSPDFPYSEQKTAALPRNESTQLRDASPTSPCPPLSHCALESVVGGCCTSKIGGPCSKAQTQSICTDHIGIRPRSIGSVATFFTTRVCRGDARASARWRVRNAAAVAAVCGGYPERILWQTHPLDPLPRAVLPSPPPMPLLRRAARSLATVLIPCPVFSALVLTCERGEDLLGQLGGPDMFHRVLCDVPCSGDGTFRKAPELWRTWSPQSGRLLHPIQLQLAMHALALTKCGGRCVYSTCSMNPLEDEVSLSEGHPTGRRAASQGVVEAEHRNMNGVLPEFLVDVFSCVFCSSMVLQYTGFRGGGIGVCNFSQFSAISHFFAILRIFPRSMAIFRNFPRFFCDLPILRACWGPLLSMVNHKSVHNHAEGCAAFGLCFNSMVMLTGASGNCAACGLLYPP